MLDIAPSKVAHIIIKARELNAKVAAWDGVVRDTDTEDEPESILEDLSGDATRDELAEFIADLNEDEQASLVALTWIGRGTYGPEELAEAIQMARDEHVNATEDYLLGIPLLADYLEEGLERLGYNVMSSEEEVLKPGGRPERE